MRFSFVEGRLVVELGTGVERGCVRKNGEGVQRLVGAAGCNDFSEEKWKQ